MHQLGRLIRTTVTGGVMFLIPLVVVVVIFGKAFQIMKVVGTPVSNWIPVESFGGFAVVEIVTVFVMLLASLLAGLLAQSSWGRRVHEKLDTALLNIPGYAWLKSVTGGMGGEDPEEVLKPVLVRFDDQSQIAFEVDRATDGLVAVYLPGSPDPRSGTVSYVTDDRVQPVDAGFKEVLKTCRNFGRGSTAMLSNQ